MGIRQAHAMSELPLETRTGVVEEKRGLYAVLGGAIAITLSWVSFLIWSLGYVTGVW